jgi:hypothetical protein
MHAAAVMMKLNQAANRIDCLVNSLSREEILSELEGMENLNF